MLYHISSEERSAGGRAGPVYTLKRNDDTALAEVWPAHGFNCLRWQIRSNKARGGLRDLLYVDPAWTENPVPTRSGVPLLFPFPNRIRDGRFRFRGKEYQLPLNDSTKKNAIHGFSPRRPWRVVDQGTDVAGAWITGAFQASVDAADTRDLWPSDYLLATTIHLHQYQLRFEFDVTNVGSEPLPFGLGMHPYFRFPYCSADEGIARYRLYAPAGSVWELDESLPTGEKRPPANELDWNTLRPLGSVLLDTVYTDLRNAQPSSDGLFARAELRHSDFGGALRLWCSRDFRELVLFTPAHRQAVCAEPYTCVTDAANLSERLVDAGWRVLEPGAEWHGVVEFRWDPNATEVLGTL